MGGVRSSGGINVVTHAIREGVGLGVGLLVQHTIAGFAAEMVGVQQLAGMHKVKSADAATPGWVMPVVRASVAGSVPSQAQHGSPS